jgi:nucleoside-diphosphate-sugar epimerase
MLSNNMKSLLFTGAVGFVGRNILHSLTKIYNVLTLDRMSADILVNLSTDIPVVKKNVDIVLHAAGKAHSIPKSKEEDRDFYAVNYQGTKNLCAGLENSGLPQSFIYISTVAVYGCESGESITENQSLKSETPYGKSKIQAEEYLLEWCERKNIRLTILRPSLLAGKILREILAK